jgi:hypothetical protein
MMICIRIPHRISGLGVNMGVNLATLGAIMLRLVDKASVNLKMVVVCQTPIRV